MVSLLKLYEVGDQRISHLHCYAPIQKVPKKTAFHHGPVPLTMLDCIPDDILGGIVTFGTGDDTEVYEQV